MVSASDSTGAEDSVGQPDFALFDQQKNRDRSDWFGYAGDAEKMHRGDRFALFAVGPPARILVNERARTTDRNESPGTSYCCINARARFDIEARSDCVGVGASCGKAEQGCELRRASR